LGYNLIDEGWIPCLLPDGGIENKSIREVLSRPKDLLEIVDPSPLVVASIHRLLIAVLERSLSLTSSEDVKRIWLDGRWDVVKIDKYLDRWHERFDLFNERRPFYQSPDFSKGKPITVNKLFNEMSTANNTVLFDRRYDDVASSIEASLAARGLIATQAFALGGGKSSTINFLHAPLVGKAMVLLKGENLCETLALNLAPLESCSPLTLTGVASAEELRNDRPTWEAEADVPGGERFVLGWLDLLTWQPRAVRLVPCEDGSDHVSSIYMAQGTVIKNEVLFDPMVSYRRSKDYGWLPIGIELNREVWRDLSALLRAGDEATGTFTLRSVAALAHEGVIASSKLYRMDVIGMCSEKAKVHQWKHARMPLPLSYLDNDLLVGYLSRAITIAERVEQCLQAGMKELATNLLYPSPGAEPDKKAIGQLIASFQVIPRYWSDVEVPFYSLIYELSSSVSQGLDREADIIRDWTRFSVTAAENALDVQIRSADNGARGMKAAVMARRRFFLSSWSLMKDARGM